MKSIIAKKVGMTQLFDENSISMGVTVLDVSGCRVVQIKSNEKDGYSAAQLTIGSAKNVAKPLAEHYKKYNVEPGEGLFEVPFDEESPLESGKEIKINDFFEVGQKVDITGFSKGKGYSGVMKRHNFQDKKQAMVFIKFTELEGQLVMPLIQAMYLKEQKCQEEWVIRKELFNQ